LTQKQVAKIAGVSRWTVMRLEAGTHTPSLNTLYCISLTLGVDLALFTDAACVELSEVS
jgi:DNA-binding XRE family transcriptional regulator